MIQYHRLSPITIDLRRRRGGSPLLETLIQSYVFFASSGSLPPDHHPRITAPGSSPPYSRSEGGPLQKREGTPDKKRLGSRKQTGASNSFMSAFATRLPDRSGLAAGGCRRTRRTLARLRGRGGVRVKGGARGEKRIPGKRIAGVSPSRPSGLQALNGRSDNDRRRRIHLVSAPGL
jgi:hypothetical protein